MEECLFCNIRDGKVPSTKVYEDDIVLAFRDIHPVAPVHVLVIPKVHISTLNDIDEKNSLDIAKIFEAIPKIALKEGLSENGYRVISNCGEDGCQVINHIHFHILGGKKLGAKLVKDE